MATTDAAFLAEVERFLTSCDHPLITLFEESNRNYVNGKPAFRHEHSSKTPSTDCHREEWRKMDAVSRHELEKAKDRKRRREYREQRRTERHNLQQEIIRLTEELEKIQGAAKTLSTLSTSSWKMVAQRQLAARKGAENQQTQLHKAIDMYATVIKEFHCLFHERLQHLNDVSIYQELSIKNEPASAFSQHKKIRFDSTDTDIFATYIKELDAVYAQTDKTLQTWCLESTEPNWDAPKEIWDKDPDTGYFQFRGKVTVPFDFKDICRSRWQVAHLLHLQDCREIYDAVNDPENTLALKFRRTTRLNSGGIASVQRWLVIRRYEAEGRMVLVWRFFTEGEGIFAGMHADETGWGVATAVEGSSKTGSVLRTCVRNARMHFSNLTAPNNVTEQFGDKLLEWGRENNEEATLGLERLLIKSE
ncbi:hypothetical protein F443_21427 [Phytophthora nicotianae P1569]|uniref:Uncharacterized protein n=1 Tax=Phytophthora nicotianae P1569 TaxID=1317065 RepID=V9DY84_PHYNI|nr:hypothetical protein F443_21427 [Phytophthora nicotianae P1569]